MPSMHAILMKQQFDMSVVVTRNPYRYARHLMQEQVLT